MKKQIKGFWVWTYEDFILVRNYVIGYIEIENQDGEKEIYYKLTGHPRTLVRADMCFKRQKDLIDFLKQNHRLWLTIEEKYILNRLLQTVKDIKDEREKINESTRKEK